VSQLGELIMDDELGDCDPSDDSNGIESSLRQDNSEWKQLQKQMIQNGKKVTPQDEFEDVKVVLVDDKGKSMPKPKLNQ
jgi:hypothetical protein